jgi:hypothetical protein
MTSSILSVVVLIFLWSSALMMIGTEADNLECSAGVVEGSLVMETCYVFSPSSSAYIYCDGSIPMVDYFTGQYVYSCDRKYVNETRTLVSLFGGDVKYSCGKCGSYVTYQSYGDCGATDYTQSSLPLGCHNTSSSSVRVSCTKSPLSMNLAAYSDETCGKMINETSRTDSCGKGPNSSGNSVKVTACVSGAVVLAGSSVSLLFFFITVAKVLFSS